MADFKKVSARRTLQVTSNRMVYKYGKIWTIDNCLRPKTLLDRADVDKITTKVMVFKSAINLNIKRRLSIDEHGEIACIDDKRLVSVPGDVRCLKRRKTDSNQLEEHESDLSSNDHDSSSGSNNIQTSPKFLLRSINKFNEDLKNVTLPPSQINTPEIDQIGSNTALIIDAAINEPAKIYEKVTVVMKDFENKSVSEQKDVRTR